MRKSKLLAGLYNVYVVFDKVSKHYIEMYFNTTDEEFVRKSLPTVIYTTPLRDIQVYKVGTFNDVTGELKSTTKKIVKTDCYLFPHSRLSPVGENLSIEEVEASIQKTKNEIIANLAESDSVENKNTEE